MDSTVRKMVELLYDVWDGYIEERAPALAKDHRPVGGGSADKQRHYASVEQRKMALVNELPYAELRARHEAAYHASRVECGMQPKEYPYSAKIVRSLLTMAKDYYARWLTHGVITDVPPLPPPDHYLFKDAVEGARKIFRERYGAVMVDGILTTAGASSSMDAGPGEDDGEDGASEDGSPFGRSVLWRSGRSRLR